MQVRDELRKALDPLLHGKVVDNGEDKAWLYYAEARELGEAAGKVEEVMRRLGLEARRLDQEDAAIFVLKREVIAVIKAWT